MIAKVYHAKDDGLVLVADVAVPEGMSVVEAREHAFERTNTIDHHWWGNKGVMAFVFPARSTSVGDVVWVDGHAYRVENVGWSETSITGKDGAT